MREQVKFAWAVQQPNRVKWFTDEQTILQAIWITNVIDVYKLNYFKLISSSVLFEISCKLAYTNRRVQSRIENLVLLSFI